LFVEENAHGTNKNIDGFFSPEKKGIYKKLQCNSTVKIRFGRKKILIYAYVLKNGVGQ
jgi:hypothetical protein